MVKKSENLEKSQKITFFQKIWKFWKYFLFAEKEKNAILLVLPIEDISLWPELSSPSHFRIQGGSPESDVGVVVVGVAGLYFSFVI